MTPFNPDLLGTMEGVSPEQLLGQEQGDDAPIDDADRYWADRSAAEVVRELKAKEREFYEFAVSAGFVTIWRLAYCQKHGLDPDDPGVWASQSVGFTGDEDEHLFFRINEARSFADQLVTMAIGHRPAFDAFATNDDYDAIGQAEAGETIVTYVYEGAFGERKERKTVGDAFWYGLGNTWVQWDPEGGDLLPPQEVPRVTTLADGTQVPARDPITGQPAFNLVPSDKRTGACVVRSVAPWNSFCDPRLDDPDDHLWRVVKQRRSRHELCALFPELKEQLLAMPGDDEFSFENLMMGSRTPFRAKRGESDQLVVKHFYHRASGALGDGFRTGRRISYVGDLPLPGTDVALEYSRVPVIPLIPKVYDETSFGYSTVWDLMCCNQLVDEVMTNSATNLSSFGRQSVWVEDGTSISAKDLANGGKLIKGKVGSKPPQTVSLAAIPESAKWFLEQLRRYMQSISGLNSVSRGDPDANISSGTMAALFHSIALEFNSGPQAAVDGHREDVANLILDILKSQAEHDLVVKIAGKDERQYLDAFNRDDLAGVRGVRLRTANPMMRTQAGRMELGQAITKAAPGTYQPEQLIEVMVSGQLKPIYDAPRKRRMLIKLENEMLQDMARQAPVQPGQQSQFVKLVQPPPQPPLPNGVQLPPPPPYKSVPGVPVEILQDHQAHIFEHEALLSSRDGIQNEALRQVVLAHIEDHKYQWQNADPAFLTAMGMRPWPAPMAPPGPPMPMGAPGPGGPPMPGGAPSPSPDAARQAGIPPTQRSRDDTTGTALPKPAQPPVKAA